MKCNAIKTHDKQERVSKIGYWCIIMMHDNPLFNLLKDPVRKLETAGLKEGFKVLEVGPGPGFYTLPAARIVGEKGRIWAIDLHPRFVKRVADKARREGLSNIIAIEGNAAKTNLPPGSLDLAFLFGLGHISGGLVSLIQEMSRIIRPGGKIAYEKSWSRDSKMMETFTKTGFTLEERKGRIMIFKKTDFQSRLND